MNAVKLQQASSWDIRRTNKCLVKTRWQMFRWPGEHGRKKPSGRWFGWVPSLGPHSPCEGDNQAVVRVLDARPQNVAAWLGLVALSYQTLLLFPCSPLARSAAPHGVSCLRSLAWVTLMASIIGLQGQLKLFSFGGSLGLWPPKHMDRFGC